MIHIESSEQSNLVRLSFTCNEKDSVLPLVDGIFQVENDYYRHGNIWDCSGDIAWGILLGIPACTYSDFPEKRILLHPYHGEESDGWFYTSEMLIKIFSKLDDWNVSVKYKKREVENMSGQNFYIECPKFGDDFKIKDRKAKRDYAHPVDSGIIKFLDNSAINSVFRQLIEMMADSTYGPIIASGIPINTNNYPELNKLVNECVEELNIKRPYVIISSSISGLNAMAFGSDEEPYIALSPFMVRTMSPQQLKFIIGHECGHVAMGHMIYHTVVSIATLFASAVPIIGPIVNKIGALPLKAWSRRSEISADRAGLLCCGDCQVAQRTLLQLEMPFMDADQIDLDEYVSNSSKYLSKGIIRKINEFDDAHPIIPKRIHALHVFTTSAKYYKVTRQPVPAGTISDAELESKTESIIKVL